MAMEAGGPVLIAVMKDLGAAAGDAFRFVFLDNLDQLFSVGGRVPSGLAGLRNKALAEMEAALASAHERVANRPLKFTEGPDTGAPFGPEQLAGGWSLLFFGFASCGDICPTTLTTLASAHREEWS